MLTNTEERNIKIRKEHDSGVDVAELVLKHELSHQRIYQILKEDISNKLVKKLAKQKKYLETNPIEEIVEEIQFKSGHKMTVRLQKDLDSRKGEWAKIAAYSGLSYSWLSKFNRGLMSNPTIESLERLETALDNI